MKPHEADEFCSIILHLNHVLAPVSDRTGRYSITVSDPHIWVWVDTLSQLVEARKAIGGEWESIDRDPLPELRQKIGMFVVVLVAYHPGDQRVEAF